MDFNLINLFVPKDRKFFTLFEQASQNLEDIS